jgi:hypothetical protein
MATYTSKINTGRISFDDQKIIGALGQGSDEPGNDTIELVPDIDLYASDRYLIIDPTGPDHIHIRAGGPQDDSDATLILGAEKSNISIDDQADAHISILSRTEDGTTSHVWQFNNDGSTRFPIINAELHNGDPQLSEVLQFANSSYQSVITNAAPAVDVDAKRIIIQGQKATGGGYGGDVYLWGGDAQKDGGNIQIYAGDADNTDDGEGSGGYVNIGGGFGDEYGGQVNIAGGANAGGEGGHVTISGGASDSTPGQVIITSNSNIWTFKNDGNITIPNGKDILDVAGNSATGGGNRYKSVNSAAAPTITYDTENIILITTTGAGAQNTTIRLPDKTLVPVGYEFTVIDLTGGAAIKTITILPKLGDDIISIGGGEGIVINTAYGLVSFKNVLAGWLILYGR